MARAGEVLVTPPNVPHRVLALEDTLAVDVFSPIRQDWLDGTDDYFRREDALIRIPRRRPRPHRATSERPLHDPGVLHGIRVVV